MGPGTQFGALLAELKAGLMFYTRLPIGHRSAADAADLARASWVAPLAGALIGSLGALVYWLADTIGLDPWPAAGLALAATLAATGALHEDGLADTADGFGGGASRERKLEIMRDSRIGTYGVCALVIALLLRAGILASFDDPPAVAMALIAAHAGARAILPLFMFWVPSARSDGLSARAGRPSLARAIAAALIGVIALYLCLDVMATIAAMISLAVASDAMRILCMRQIGGQTGDVLGALEQISEIVILFIASIEF